MKNRHCKYLWTPIRVGTIEIKNRVAMLPMGTNLASPDGEVTQSLIAYYAARTQGGVGLIITEAVGGGPKYGTNTLLLTEDRLIPGWKELARSVRAAGGRMAPQLIHPGFTSLPT